jgi:hypothetical protein
MNRTSRVSNVSFFLLKSLNLLGSTTYAFATIYVFVRVLPADVYSSLILTLAIANYLSAADLGYANYLYATLRKSFIAGSVATGVVETVSTIYLGLALVSSLVVLICLLLTALDLKTQLALSLFFLSSSLNLPWNLLRKSAAAIDRYLEIEAIEAARRVLSIAVLGSILFGVSFLLAGVIQMLVWLFAYFAVFAILRRQNIRIFSAGTTAMAAHLRHHAHAVSISGSLWLLEFIIYNFPYVALAIIYPNDNHPIVIFDLFYKVTRFAALTFAVPAEVLLPQQTRAFHEGRIADARRAMRIAGGLALLGLLMAEILLYFVGAQVFARLLGGRFDVSFAVILAMGIMLCLTWVISVKGTFLLGIGRLASITRSAAITVSLSIPAVAITFVFKLDIVGFLFSYIILFSIFAAMYYKIYRRVVLDATLDRELFRSRQ